MIQLTSNMRICFPGFLSHVFKKNHTYSGSYPQYYIKLSHTESALGWVDCIKALLGNAHTQWPHLVLSLGLVSLTFSVSVCAEVWNSNSLITNYIHLQYCVGSH